MAICDETRLPRRAEQVCGSDNGLGARERSGADGAARRYGPLGSRANEKVVQRVGGGGHIRA
jgi:hypothetical protein